MTTETQVRPSSSRIGYQNGSSDESGGSGNAIKDIPNRIEPRADLESSEQTAVLESSRKAQDKALADIGLYRFLIPEDGNCLFRAIASQLNLEQEEAHHDLRREAAKWMRAHAEELLAYGLLDSLDEIAETAKVGVWPGQAALVAMANVRKVNIAIIQGGDRGPIDIQHIAPFEDMPEDRKPRSVMLAYLYSGHYDGVAYEDKANPEYAAWRRQVRRRANTDEQLAQNIALEDSRRDSLGVTSSRRATDYASSYSSSKYTSNSVLEPSSPRSAYCDSRSVATSQRPTDLYTSKYAVDDTSGVTASKRTADYTSGYISKYTAGNSTLYSTSSRTGDGDSRSVATSKYVTDYVPGQRTSKYAASNTKGLDSLKPAADDVLAPTFSRQSGVTSAKKSAFEDAEPERYDNLDDEDQARPRTALSGSSNSSALSKHSRKSETRLQSPLSADYDNIIHSIGLQEEEERRTAERPYTAINVKHVVETDRGHYSDLNGYYNRPNENYLYSSMNNQFSSYGRGPSGTSLASSGTNPKPQSDFQLPRSDNPDSSRILSRKSNGDSTFSDSEESSECERKTKGYRTTRPVLQHSHTFDNSTGPASSSRMPSSRTAGNVYKTTVELEEPSHGSSDRGKYSRDRALGGTRTPYAPDGDKYIVSDVAGGRRERESSFGRGGGDPELDHRQVDNRQQIASARTKADREVIASNDVKVTKHDPWFENTLERIRDVDIGAAQRLEKARAHERVYDQGFPCSKSDVQARSTDKASSVTRDFQPTSLNSTDVPLRTSHAAYGSDDYSTDRKTDKRAIGSSEMQPDLARHMYGDPTYAAQGRSSDTFDASTSRSRLGEDDDSVSRVGVRGRDSSRLTSGDFLATRLISNVDDKRYTSKTATYYVERHLPSSSVSTTHSSSRHHDLNFDVDRRPKVYEGHTSSRSLLSDALPPRSGGVTARTHNYSAFGVDGGISRPAAYHRTPERSYLPSSSSSLVQRPTSASHSVHDRLYSDYGRRGSLTSTARSRQPGDWRQGGTRPAWK